jgi:hypothetical protein
MPRAYYVPMSECFSFAVGDAGFSSNRLVLKHGPTAGCLQKTPFCLQKRLSSLQKNLFPFLFNYWIPWPLSKWRSCHPNFLWIWNGRHTGSVDHPMSVICQNCRHKDNGIFALILMLLWYSSINEETEKFSYKIFEL